MLSSSHIRGVSPPAAFMGGGTYFETLGSAPLQQAQGHAMCHASGARHAGFAITAGHLWVLVFFLHAERAPLHAARCYAQAVERRRAGQPVRRSRPLHRRCESRRTIIRRATA
jgi:hypothetical protein